MFCNHNAENVHFCIFQILVEGSRQQIPDNTEFRERINNATLTKEGIVTLTSGETVEPTMAGKKSRGPKVKLKYQKYYIILFSVILIGVVITTVLQFWPHAIDSDSGGNNYYISAWNSLPEVRVMDSAPLPPKGDLECSYFTCFDVYRCSYETNRISLYIYPMKKYMDEAGEPILGQISREFYDILIAISESQFFTPDPDKACIFVPPLDLLNQNSMNVEKVGQILAQLPRYSIMYTAQFYTLFCFISFP